MASDEEIRQFVTVYVPSIWALEILLKMHADQERRWRATELLKDLRASKTVVDENLSRFERYGLVLMQEEHWQFAPANSWLKSMTDELSVIYKERPVYTVGLIARADQLRSLAEAFRIKRDDP